MGNRIELHNKLVDILGSVNVYFQPPESIKLSYPCIIYERNPGNVIFADDAPYRQKRRYTITVIDRNPDTDIPDRLAQLPLCRADRFYTADNLNHYTYTIYF